MPARRQHVTRYGDFETSCTDVLLYLQLNALTSESEYLCWLGVLQGLADQPDSRWALSRTDLKGVHPGPSRLYRESQPQKTAAERH
jgi:hypothetical protein